MMIKRAAILSLLLALFVGVPSALATPYGQGSFGNCSYQTSCPAPAFITSAPPAGTPVPDASPAPAVVASDIDKDGNNEQAINADGNSANGFERFVDPDGSSVALMTVDGEHNGATGFIVDTNGDGNPDIYWSPSSQYVAPVKVEQRGEDIYWIYVNAKGSRESVLVDHKKATNHVVFATKTFSRITPADFGGPVYQSVGQLVERVPPVAAYSFPYLLLLLLLILIGRLLLQTRREFVRMETIAKTTEQERELALEKQNFLKVASRYLRTPVSAIKESIELAKSQRSIPEESVALLNDQVKSMQVEIDTLLANMTNDQDLRKISDVQATNKKPKNILLSPYIYLPLGGILLLGVFANFIFVDFWVTQPTIINFVVQVLLVLILGQWFISSARKRSINKQDRLDKQRVLEEERGLDKAHSAFVSDAARTLTDKVEAYDQKLSALAASGHDVARFHNGFDHLKDTLSKLDIASGLHTAVVEMDRHPLNSADIVSSVTERAGAMASSRNITLLSKSEGGMLTQNQTLLTTALDSLADSAIKYSPENAQVTMSQRNDGPNVRFAVEGKGLHKANAQLDTLPDAGGFGIHLAQLIAHYLGGSITVLPTANEYAVAELSLPRA